MSPSTSLLVVGVLLLAISSTIISVSAFTIARPHGSTLSLRGPDFKPIQPVISAPRGSMLFGSKKSKGFAKATQNGETASADDDDNDDDAPEETSAETTTTTTVSQEEETSDDDDDVDDDNQPSEEDQLITSLKEAIHNSESELKAKKSTLSRIEEDVEKYTKVGYARRVAQMEDMRRIRLVRFVMSRDVPWTRIGCIYVYIHTF